MTLTQDEKKILGLLKKGFFTIEELEERTGVENVTDTINSLKLQDYDILAWERKNYKAYYLNRSITENFGQSAFELKVNENELFRPAIVSDTHLGDKSVYLKQLHKCYHDIHEDNRRIVFHGGDLTAGLGVYRTQIQDMLVYGVDDLVEYVVENYPEQNDVITYYVPGNHDARLKETQGINLCKMISEQRKDLVYVGMLYGRVKLSNGANIDEWHYTKGMARPYSKCFDDKTEIFTKEGWVLFNQLKKEIPVATLNKKGYFEWKKPSDIIKEYFKGELIHITGQAVDLLTTPNHNHWVKKHTRPERGDKPDSFHFVTAEELLSTYSRQKYHLKRNCEWKGKNFEQIKLKAIKGSTYNTKDFIIIDDEAFLNFLGWFISEGCAYPPGRISIAQNKQENIVEIVEAITRLGLKPNFYRDKKRGDGKVSTNSKQLRLWLNECCGIGSRNKKVPEFIKDLKPELIKIFLKALFKGDGHFYTNGKMAVYSTNSKKLCDDVCELLLKTNKTASVGIKKATGVYAVHVGHTVSQEPAICHKPKRVWYDGYVYCVNVPNHIIMIRRNGKTCWSGNSYRQQKATEYLIDILGGVEADSNDLPTILVLGHNHENNYVKHLGVHVFEGGGWQGPGNAWALGKGFVGTPASYFIDAKFTGRKIDDINIMLKRY